MKHSQMYIHSVNGLNYSMTVEFLSKGLVI